MYTMSNLLRLGLAFLFCVTLVRVQEIPDYDEEPCLCVKYHFCSDDTISTKADRNLIDPRSTRRREATSSIIPSRVKECPGQIDICCKLSKITDGTPTAEPTCGLRNAQGVSASLNDLDGEAEFGEFPWMVALLREEVTDGLVFKQFVGGGSLIHPQVVLTAAQIVFPYRNDSNSMMIRAGEWDTQTKNERFEHQDRRAREIIIHEGNDDDQLLNDVALLILQEPVRAAEHIGFVCLPSQGQNFDFSSCFASGWGKNIWGTTGRFQTILKKIELAIVPSRPTCQNALRKARLGPAYLLPESFICAGGNGTADTCQGDGGSPLVCPIANHPTHYQQTGIVSWGLRCGAEYGTPGVYTNVALFRNWVDQKMVTLNFDKSSYTYSN